MSGGQVVAHVRRVLTGHSDRALIHAVADANLEIKIEVPAASVRDVSPDRGHVLVVSWSLLELPRAAEPAAAPTAPAEPKPATAAPGGPKPANAGDAEFMALMARARRPAPEPAVTSPTATSGPGPEQQIAALLGLVPGRPT